MCSLLIFNVIDVSVSRVVFVPVGVDNTARSGPIVEEIVGLVYGYSLFWNFKIVCNIDGPG